MDLRYIAPFPAEQYPLLWQWVCEKPEANLDDSGPSSLAEFIEWMAKRVATGHVVIQAVYNGEPVGAVAYREISQEIAMFQGICFAQRYCGCGIARVAVSHVVSELFAQGFRRIYAEYFSTNAIVERFLEKLGAVEIEQKWRTTTTQGGEIIPVKTVMLDDLHFRANGGSRNDSQRPGPPIDLPAHA